MKTMALEEHSATRELMDAWEEVNPRWRELPLFRDLRVRTRTSTPRDSTPPELRNPHCLFHR